jgi:hypothetical protein
MLTSTLQGEPLSEMEMSFFLHNSVVNSVRSDMVLSLDPNSKFRMLLLGYQR